MDFARAQLEKYGWKEGEGLGRNKTGISEAIKPKLKSDKSGLGLDISEEFTYNWWEHAFNAAAQRINVEKDNEDGVKIKTKKLNGKELRISTKRRLNIIIEDEDKDLTYGRFKKTAKLCGSKEERIATNINKEITSPIVPEIKISDDDLFKACGGRTAHKSARHGKGLSGKLARLEEQDKKFNKNDTNCEIKSKKHKKKNRQKQKSD